MQQQPEALNLERALAVLRRRALLVGLCVVVVAGAAYGFSKRETKKYTATATLSFTTNSLSQQIAGLQGGSTLSTTQLLAQLANNVELVKNAEVARKTAAALGHRLTAEAVATSLSVSSQPETGIVAVGATTTSPAHSTEIVNTYVQQFAKQQAASQLRYYKTATGIVRRQLAALAPKEKAGSVGVLLQSRLATLTLLSQLNEPSVKVAAEAATPTAPSSPKTSRNTIFGIIVGLLIGLGLAFVLERLDRRIRAPEDLVAIYHLPLLGSVPESSALARYAREKGGARAVLPPAEAEVFSLVRAHLRFFNVDRDVRTIVVASPTPGDGKTTVARHLAEAAARSSSRVLLLEVDLRHPTLARQFGIQPGPGLADVLIGLTPMGEATRSVAVEAPPGEGATGRTLDVLVAGAVLPPNPGELLDSHAMASVLVQAKSAYDLVVIDTPPLAAVSDAFPLLTKVDGVVVVGWVGRSGRDAAQRLHTVLASSGAPLLGVVANGSKLGDASAYSYTRDTEAPSEGATARGKTSIPSSSEELVPTAET